MKELGVGAATVGYIQSIYSATQIVGGIVLAIVSDRGLLSRRGVLIVSFVGAALSYGIVGCANSVAWLLFSRVVVGLVKQTSTISSAMVAEWTTPHARAAAMGRLGTAMTLGWMSGQALGGVLATRVHMSAPPAAAVLLYGFDALFVLYFLPAGTGSQAQTNGAESTQQQQQQQRVSTAQSGGTLALLRSVLQDGDTAKVLAVQACYDIMSFGLHAMMLQYETERYNFTPEQLGLLGSARAAVGVLIQGFVVGAVIGKVGETAALRIGLIITVLAYAGEGYLGETTTWFVYAAVLMPVKAFTSFIARIGLKSLVTSSAAPSSALAAVDVIHSITGVVGPTVGGVVLVHGGVGMYPFAAAAGYSLVLVLLLLLFGVERRAGEHVAKVKRE